MRLFQGRDNSEGKYFGFLEADIVGFGEANNVLTLSPVPFGLNGKPELPYKGEEREKLLWTARTILIYGDVWTGEKLRQEMDHFKWFMPHNAWPLLQESAMLGLTRYVPERNVYEVAMMPQEFMDIFGVELPDTIPQKKA